MSTCHNLSIIDEQLSGDPIDIYMFNFTGCKLHDSSLENSSKYGNICEKYKPHIKSFVTLKTNFKMIVVLKHFTFDSALQRMSVITNDGLDESLYVYTKGSPDKILSMCIKNSIPNGIKEELENYTKIGHRVLAVAYKNLSFSIEWSDVNKIPRDEIESNLLFAGIIIFENVIKPGTHETIKMLNQANIRTAMATGDDLLTASFIAREINMISPDQDLIELSFLDGRDVYKKLENSKIAIFLDEKGDNCAIDVQHSFDMRSTENRLKYSLALSGTSFETIHRNLPHLLPKILVSGTVFARMSPNQKTMLVEDLQKIGYGVGMCGDGANDCGALKAAHAGMGYLWVILSISNLPLLIFIKKFHKPQSCKNHYLRSVLLTRYCSILRRGINSGTIYVKNI